MKYPATTYKNNPIDLHLPIKPNTPLNHRIILRIKSTLDRIIISKV